MATGPVWTRPPPPPRVLTDTSCCSCVTCVGKVAHPPQLFPVAVQVARRPPSLRARLCILDPLLEVSQCSGEGAGHTLGFGLPLILLQVSSIPQMCPCRILAVLCSLLLSLQFWHWYQHGSAALPIAHPELTACELSARALHTAESVPLSICHLWGKCPTPGPTGLDPHFLLWSSPGCPGLAALPWARSWALLKQL